jgi:hypothetical protein
VAPSDERNAVSARLPRARENPKFSIDEVDYDCTDGSHITTTSSSANDEQSPVMWIVTEAKE